jgi:Tol biopolymer transport system component
MTLAPGTRLGPYEIVAPLGAGGMGEVWRARDTRLGREVAIKVLPEAFAADPALRARFDREAKTISSLNHPNICTLYDVGREGDTDFLVLELVEGETLALRIARGPLPLSDLLRYGMQMTDALEKAHKAGIIHRDLKPGNIMLTKAGAKLLDFGLARGGPGAASAPSSATISPTMTGPLTAQGHIVGTFQYMAPEQLEGTEADARSDLWALGCVLYEMATGKPAFAGTSQASLISSIMKDEPKSLGELAPMSPPALDRAIRQCLAKDPDERWQSAGDLKRELAWISASGSQASAIGVGVGPGRAGVRPTFARRLRTWALPFVAGLALAGAAWFALGRGGDQDSPARLSLLHPGVAEISGDPADVVISPDGTSLAYVVNDSTGAELWVRRLGDERGHAVDRSAGPIRTPFWSADSRQVAYFTSGDEGRLWRVSAEGGSPVPLAPASSGRGGAWNRDNLIVFAPAPAGPLLRVSASGGDVTQATVLDTTAGETAHRAPRFVPDGDHFLYTALPAADKGFAIRVGSLKSGKSELLVHLPQGGAEYAAPGYLLYSREGKLVARAFDAGSRKLAAETIVLADAVALSNTSGHPIVSAARTGRLAWLPVALTNTRLEWVDRSGRVQGPIEAPEGGYFQLAVAGDGKRALVARYRASGEIEIYAYDPERGSLQRVSPAGATSYAAVWAPDGESFYMRTGRSGRDEIARVSLSQGGEPVIIKTTDHQFKGPNSVTADGRSLLFIALGKDTGWDLWTADLAGKTPPRVLLDDASNVDGALSADGRWLAVTTQGGTGDLFVAPLDRPRNQKRLATAISGLVQWSANGRELFYHRTSPDGMAVYALPFDPTTGAAAGPEQLLFRRVGGVTWSAAPDGSRFLLSIENGAPQRTRIELGLDWTKLPRAK